MVDCRDIWRSAKLLIDKHGDKAAIVAAQCVDELLDRGDMEGKSIWLRIVKAIEEMASTDHEGKLN